MGTTNQDRGDDVRAGERHLRQAQGNSQEVPERSQAVTESPGESLGVGTTTCRLEPCSKPQSTATCFCTDHTPLWVKSPERAQFFKNHTCDDEPSYEVCVQAFVKRNTLPAFLFDWVPV